MERFPLRHSLLGFIVEYDAESGIPTLVNIKAWYCTNNTCIASTVMGDVDSDSQVEVVTGGYYNDVFVILRNLSSGMELTWRLIGSQPGTEQVTL